MADDDDGYDSAYHDMGNGVSESSICSKAADQKIFSFMVKALDVRLGSFCHAVSILIPLCLNSAVSKDRKGEESCYGVGRPPCRRV